MCAPTCHLPLPPLVCAPTCHLPLPPLVCAPTCHLPLPPLVCVPSASDEHKFKDSSSLYYRFTADDSLDESNGKKLASSPQARKQEIIRRLREVAVRKVEVSVWMCCGVCVWWCDVVQCVVMRV